MGQAVVVGAGVGGLAAAGALARAGWRVTLIEQADRLRTDPAALLIWPNGLRALRSLGLGDGLAAIGTPVPPGGLRRADGSWLVQPGVAAADRQIPVVVHHEDLHDVLIAKLTDRVEIRTGITVKSGRGDNHDRPSVTDGRTTWDADLIVAADGTSSTLRRIVAPEAGVASSGYAAWRAVIPWYRAPQLGGDVVFGGETMGSGYRFFAASLGDRGSAGGSTRGGIYWQATVAGAARPESAATQLNLLRRWFERWPSPVSELLAATEAGDVVQHDVREVTPSPLRVGVPSGTGGIVLLGDAAHGMAHHLTQGACLAFEDAAILASLTKETLPGQGLRASVSAYSAARASRGAEVARQSKRVGALLADRGRVATRARDAAFGLLQPRVLDKARASAANWFPPK
ncbi:2-polyprenyl-6-methoxyphenol hydroxylase-like FAD-dependent oxidoreductase [Allocatelliglobosispora scoriae]|uniref:2-polyprenyl-6-methoxyphenol hydroxylase-like FAD-dependent oxidoreductase n=1 Tax=Allocatelliglobosispora scoriae TaxID=643052 RepID=A0A841BPL9_9ACTN|nr:NAD(P)/FAD-dependent oxidoreductase [Allocatelliglobosispora scoriae]MBB5869318.1 2-polyprenyl-6-methoxyphenol hydroxylase-like FAD-dependent oxidoreductase [Allocatelliglobosispora scoriae]